MKSTRICLFVAFLALWCVLSPQMAQARQASVLEPINVEKLVEAIGKAENSRRFPYGVKSINTHGDKALARKICRQSVINNLRRWKEAGMPCEFVLYMSKRYCPINATDDPNGLNANWTKNVLHFYHKES